MSATLSFAVGQFVSETHFLLLCRRPLSARQIVPKCRIYLPGREHIHHFASGSHFAVPFVESGLDQLPRESEGVLSASRPPTHFCLTTGHREGFGLDADSVIGMDEPKDAGTLFAHSD
jgi:hypothetical protein